MDIDVVVDCSSGTYIRALARDLGAAVGSAGHLIALRRTAIGPIGVGECAELGEEPPPVVPIETVVSRLMPTVTVDDDVASALRNGRKLSLDEPDGTYVVMDADGNWVSVVSIDGGRTRIEVNAPTPSPTDHGSLTR